MCIDGFPDGELKDKIRDTMESDSSSHQCLLSFSFDEDASKQSKVNRSSENDLPLWVNRQERRFLKGKFKNKLMLNVIMATDVNGKFKTIINDVLTTMPRRISSMSRGHSELLRWHSAPLSVTDLSIDHAIDLFVDLSADHVADHITYLSIDHVTVLFAGHVTDRPTNYVIFHRHKLKISNTP
ncbi:hypothetical protein ABZP36_024655 [Zizania latifolia]